jgi:hypothetical protein
VRSKKLKSKQHLLQLVRRLVESTRLRRPRELHWRRKRGNVDLLRRKHSWQLIYSAPSKRRRMRWHNSKRNVRRLMQENC